MKGDCEYVVFQLILCKNNSAELPKRCMTVVNCIVSELDRPLEYNSMNSVLRRIDYNEHPLLNLICHLAQPAEGVMSNYKIVDKLNIRTK